MYSFVSACYACKYRHNYYHSILSLVPRPVPPFPSFQCCLLLHVLFSVHIEKAAMGIDQGRRLWYGSLVHVCIHHRYLVSTPSAMTDQERDEIDSAAQDFIRSCSDKIENLHHKGTLYMYTLCVLARVSSRIVVMKHKCVEACYCDTSGTFMSFRHIKMISLLVYNVHTYMIYWKESRQCLEKYMSVQLQGITWV